MINIKTKLPIFIIANCRSGSNSLAKSIAKNHNIDCFLEPMYHPALISPLQECIDNSKQFVLKIIVDQFYSLKLHQQILTNNCFKIRLNRTDKISQLISYYVATKRQKFSQLTTNVPSYSVDIDLSLMNQLAQSILLNDQLLSRMPVSFDADFLYESLEFDSSANFKTTAPDNIEELKLAAISIIKNLSS